MARTKKGIKTMENKQDNAIAPSDEIKTPVTEEGIEGENTNELEQSEGTDVVQGEASDTVKTDEDSSEGEDAVKTEGETEASGDAVALEGEGDEHLNPPEETLVGAEMVAGDLVVNYVTDPVPNATAAATVAAVIQEHEPDSAVGKFRARHVESVFTQVIREDLANYIKAMKPNQPVVESQVVANQAMLYKVYDRILKVPSVETFKEAMFALSEIMRANEGTFSSKYINRGMSQVQLSTDARQRLETLNFLLPGVFGPNGAAFYNNYAAKAIQVFQVEEQRQRLNQWLKYFLNIE